MIDKRAAIAIISLEDKLMIEDLKINKTDALRSLSVMKPGGEVRSKLI